MISNEEGCHDHAVRESSALLRGITSKHNGYCFFLIAFILLE